MNENSDDERLEISDEEEAFDPMAFNKALDLLSQRDTILKISGIAKAITGDYISLCVSKNHNKSERDLIYFVITSAKPITLTEYGRVASEITRILQCKDIYIIQKNLYKKEEDFQKDVGGLTKFSTENLKSILAFLMENFPQYFPTKTTVASPRSAEYGSFWPAESTSPKRTSPTLASMKEALSLLSLEEKKELQSVLNLDIENASMAKKIEKQ